MLNIVLIDDDPISTFVTEKLISKNVKEPCKFFKYQSAKRALEEIKSINPHYLFLDLNMPEMTGWDFLDKFHPSDNDARIIKETFTELGLEMHCGNNDNKKSKTD